VKQVILLSHDPAFLQQVHEASHGCEVKTLQLGTWGPAGTKLTNWDIIDAVKNGYIQLFTVLLTFVIQRTGARQQVAQSIRLLLEQYMRLKLPSSFTVTEWLGDFIGKIRECTDPSTPLYNAKDILEELSYINDFSKKYHHSTPGADVADILSFKPKPLTGSDPTDVQWHRPRGGSVQADWINLCSVFPLILILSGRAG
jgi:wobble nucleotide-excising tRNase